MLERGTVTPMLRPTTDYPAAYTHVEGSQEPEVARLLEWLGLPIHKVAVVCPDVRSQRTAVPQALKRSGALIYSVKDGWARKVPVLALWLDDRQLTRVEGTNPAKVALAAWSLADIDIWRRARSPVELAGAEVPERVALDPVVQVAMESVAMMSNPANGLASYNRSNAVQAFRVLRRNGYTWDPIECAVVMANSGWNLVDAREFAKLSADMLAGKALQGRGQFRSDIIRIWRKEAAERA